MSALFDGHNDPLPDPGNKGWKGDIGYDRPLLVTGGLSGAGYMVGRDNASALLVSGDHHQSTQRGDDRYCDAQYPQNRADNFKETVRSLSHAAILTAKSLTENKASL